MTQASAAPDIEFRSAYDQGFARVAAVTLPVVPGNPAANAAYADAAFISNRFRVVTTRRHV